MSRADGIKEVAVALGLPPRKSSAAMIDEIMESQGWTEEEGEEVAEPVVVTQEVEQEGALESTTTGSAELVETLERFPQRLHDVLDQFLTDLAKTIEGVIFNATEAGRGAAVCPQPPLVTGTLTWPANSPTGQPRLNRNPKRPQMSQKT